MGKSSNALKRSPGIIRKSRVSYPGPGFLSSATWPSLPKKHYNGLNQTKPKLNLLKTKEQQMRITIITTLVCSSISHFLFWMYFHDKLSTAE